jgi:DNA repair protein RadC
MLVQEAVAEYLKGEAEPMELIRTAEDVYKKCRHLCVESNEHAVVLLCKQNLRLIKEVEVANGSQTECFFDVRTIIREALLNNATAIFMVHNHVSGAVRPSALDDRITKRIKDACELMLLHLVDHVIVGRLLFI